MLEGVIEVTENWEYVKNLEVRACLWKVIFEPVKRSGYRGNSDREGEQVQSPKMGTSMEWVDTDFHWKE